MPALVLIEEAVAECLQGKRFGKQQRDAERSGDKRQEAGEDACQALWQPVHGVCAARVPAGATGPALRTRARCI